MRCVAMPMVSVPCTLTEPLRAPVRPMMARSVVVRPAPLRPSRVTTCPCGTVMSMPCRMWLSPYQACRPLISMAGAAEPLAMSVGPLEFAGLAAHVGLEHGRVARHLGIRAFGQDRAAREHRDA